MDFSSDMEMRLLSNEVREFFDVLYDEEPIFVSDEATVWDVSTSPLQELLQRCSQYYGKTLAEEEMNQPLWKLLRKLNEGRHAGNDAGTK
jgi:hypothetical protein